MKDLNSIVSLATPIGTGALSIIRCSGKGVKNIIETFFLKSLTPRYAYHIDFKKNNETLDDIVAIYYKAPESYTGEDMLEITCHGGPVIYQMLIKEILTLSDFRLAMPGEFSERAYLNNKISLLEAESICALINAKTEEAALAARSSLSGKMSQEILSIDEKLLKIRIQVEALLDFSEEDIETAELYEIENQLIDIKNKIKNLIEKTEKNKLFFELSKITIIGKPNTGKSSLINFLTQENVSIVNKEAGTTRDVVSKIFNIRGMPVIIQDTAGIRETDNQIEQEGTHKAFDQAAESNVILYLYDVSKGLQKDDFLIIDKLKKINTNLLIIGNKVDLTVKNLNSLLRDQKEASISISIKRNINIEKMIEKISDILLKTNTNDSSPGVMQIKHLAFLKTSFNEINSIKLDLSNLEVVAEFLKAAQQNLSKIIENDDNDRVLSGIFSNFCIGK